MKTLVNKALRRFGYEIRSIKPPPIYTQKKSTTKGLTVEFIGSSGVGKTTFFNKIRIHQCRKDWFVRNDLYKSLPYGVDMDSLKYANYKLRDVYTKMLSYSYHRLQEMEFPLHRIIETYNYFVQIAKYDTLIRHESFSKGFLLDDGFLKNFAKEVVYIHSLAQEGKVERDDLKYLLKNRIVVYLHAEEDYIINNLKSRAVKTPDVINNYHSFYDKDQLRYFVKKEIANMEKLFFIAKENNVKTLCLNMENEEEEQLIEKFNYFISNLINDKKSMDFELMYN
ncbi:MAG: hypothetical protein LBV41_10630 [Cytophagaceae bacterium]|jgi:hypothetical protein|nr:hypothetical protein [Cytophagaceae bacterium]